MKIAIFLPNWIGDVVMATPTLRAVRNRYPNAEIIGIMRPYVADVLAGTSLLDRTLFYNPRGHDPSHRGWKFLSRLGSEKLDIALLLPNSIRTAVLAWLSGAKRRVGFARDARGWLLTDPVDPLSKRQPYSAMNQYLRLAEALDCCCSSRQSELAVLPDDLAAMEQFWKAHSVIANHAHPQPFAQSKPSYVCLNTGGAFGAAKNWPRENFAELARRISTELHQAVLIVCGPSERDDARWIAAEARRPDVVSLADVPLSIGLTKAAIKDAALLVTTDSGPRHFAAPFETPVVTLFGPTHIGWSETFYPRGEHLQLKLDCGPCQQRECPLKHHRCMRDMTVEMVFEAARRQLTKYRQKQKAAS